MELFHPTHKCFSRAPPAPPCRCQLLFNQSPAIIASRPRKTYRGHRVSFLNHSTHMCNEKRAPVWLGYIGD